MAGSQAGAAAAAADAASEAASAETASAERRSRRSGAESSARRPRSPEPPAPPPHDTSATGESAHPVPPPFAVPSPPVSQGPPTHLGLGSVPASVRAAAAFGGAVLVVLSFATSALGGTPRPDPPSPPPAATFQMNDAVFGGATPGP